MDYSFRGRKPPAQLAVMATNFNPVNDQTWYADSGATHHITNDLKNLKLHSDYQGSDKVVVGNGQGLPILLFGSPTILTPTYSFKFNNILHVPHISSNLFSVHKFTKDNDCVFVFDSSGFLIQDCSLGKILFPRTEYKWSLLISWFTTTCFPSGPSAFLGQMTSATIWPQRLRHPSSSILQSVISRFHLPLTASSTTPIFYEFCRYAKSCKLPFRLSDTVTKQPLELIHSDVCGPIPTPFVCGFKYYVLFIDDFSKYTWMFPLHSKSNVFHTFRLFKLKVENLLSSKIKMFKTDGGGEFLNNQFQTLLREHGIVH